MMMALLDAGAGARSEQQVRLAVRESAARAARGARVTSTDSWPCTRRRSPVTLGNVQAAVVSATGEQLVSGKGVYPAKLLSSPQISGKQSLEVGASKLCARQRAAWWTPGRGVIIVGPRSRAVAARTRAGDGAGQVPRIPAAGLPQLAAGGQRRGGLRRGQGAQGRDVWHQRPGVHHRRADWQAGEHATMFQQRRRRGGSR